MAENEEQTTDTQVPLDTIPISPAKENVDPNSKSEDGAMNGTAKSGDEQITVFHDKDNFNVKHPLMHEWTLWFTKPPSGKVRLVLGHRSFMPDTWTDQITRVIIGTICSRKLSHSTL